MKRSDWTIGMIAEYIEQLNHTRIDRYDIANNLKVNERRVRRAISQLAKTGIIYIPVRKLKGVYKLQSERDLKAMEGELHILVKSMRETYFNRVLPLKRAIKAHAKELEFPALIEQVEQLELIFDKMSETAKGEK